MNNAPAEKTEIEWLTIEQAEAKAKKDPSKKIIIDVYTTWCGWCKKMDAHTFTDPKIVKYINEKYYAVKLNAEMSGEVMYKGEKLTKTGRTHEVALKVTGGNIAGYPTVAFLDGKLNVLTAISSYLQPGQLDPILHYFGENAYTQMPWEDYQKTYKP